MVTIYDVDPTDLIEEAANELKSVHDIVPPSWASLVKTGVFKERPPVQEDWWYIRTAAVLRSVYKLGPIGVSKLRTKYGGRKNRGSAPDHTFKGSGAIIRKILQQLEKTGFIKQGKKGLHKGRVITPAGKSFMDKAASKIYKAPMVEEKAQPEEAPKEAPKEAPRKRQPKKEAHAEQPKKEEPAEQPKVE